MSTENININNLPIIKEDIINYFSTLKQGRELLDNWNEVFDTDLLSKEEWLDALQLHLQKQGEEYARNTQLYTKVFLPIVQDPSVLTDELADCTFDCIKDMYLNDYDDPFTLWYLGTSLIPHYKKSRDLDRLIFCYQAAGYGALEISRTGDHHFGRLSVRYFKKIISYKNKLELFHDDYSKTIIFIAYSNLIRVEVTLNNMSVKQLYEIWQDFSEYRSKEYSHQYDEQIPRIPVLCDFIDTDFRVYCTNAYSIETTRKDFSTTKKYNPEFHKKLSAISSEFMKPIVENEEHPLHNAPDIYCNYQELLALDGAISWDEAWQHMDTFHQLHPVKECVEHDYAHSDSIAIIINPLQRMVESLYLSSFSMEEKNRIACNYCDETPAFAKLYPGSDVSYAMNSAMEGICYNPYLLKCLTSSRKKEDLFFNFIITRHASTFMHSRMVQRAALIMLDSIFEHCPEYLIGLLGTKSVDDVIAQVFAIRSFVEKAALYHDMGKNALIDIINTDYRKITDTEFKIIQKHPEIGAKYLSMDSAFKPYKDVALGHHKFYNGQGGYPKAFHNQNSPDKPIIDLITICDCLDAATDYLGRNYQRAKSFDQVLAEFKEGAGTRYHPGYVNLLFTDDALRHSLEHLITAERKDIYYDVYVKSHLI